MCVERKQSTSQEECAKTQRQEGARCIQGLKPHIWSKENGGKRNTEQEGPRPRPRGLCGPQEGGSYWRAEEDDIRDTTLACVGKWVWGAGEMMQGQQRRCC